MRRIVEPRVRNSLFPFEMTGVQRFALVRVWLLEHLRHVVWFEHESQLSGQLVQILVFGSRVNFERQDEHLVRSEHALQPILHFLHLFDSEK